MMKTPNSC